MHKSLLQFITRRARFAATVSAVALLALVPQVQGADMELPNAAEVQYYSPEAQQFYAAGVAALDKADYSNAYNMLAKASALQPAAVHLNHITAKLSVYHGRQHGADAARDYYDTAIACFTNILSVPTISGDTRRAVANELKTAQLEKENLAQRDVMREATGTSFFLDYNRRYANKKSRKAGTISADAPATTITEEIVNPVAAMMMETPALGQDFGMMDTGVGGEMGMPNAGMPAAPGMGGPMQPPAGVQPGGPGMGVPGEVGPNTGGQPTQPF